MGGVRVVAHGKVVGGGGRTRYNTRHVSGNISGMRSSKTHRLHQVSPGKGIGKLYEIPEADLRLLLVGIAAMTEVRGVWSEVGVKTLQPAIGSAAIQIHLRPRLLRGGSNACLLACFFA